MQRVKYESTTTGTGALTLTVPTGFQAIGVAETYPTAGSCIYTIIDGNGTGWETGYGTISGSTLTRGTFLFQSSAGAGGAGFYDKISCSATTPHTVIISRQGFEGHILLASFQDTTGTAFSTASSTTMAGLAADIDGQQYAWDAVASGSAATIVADPMTELAIARAYRLTFTAECDDTSAGNYFGCGIRMNSETKDRVSAWAPLIGTDTICSCTTPIIEATPPFADANSGHKLNDGGAVVYTMYNTSGGSITVKPTIYVEWYL